MGKLSLPAPSEAFQGRAERMPVPPRHLATGAPLVPPFPDGYETAVFALGCFWGAERLFWQVDGVFTTASGYAGGLTPNPTYEEVCTGLTGHTESVLVVFDPDRVGYNDLLKLFWESHDPTQGMRQGNDVGTQYRSAIYFANEDQRREALASRDAYQRALDASGRGGITTEIAPAPSFYYAEPEHQQYLERYPWGYCGLHGTGVGCPSVGIPAVDASATADVEVGDHADAQAGVDDASRDSFPASDPPSRTGVTGVRPRPA